MQIRPFVESDQDAVVQLWRSVFAYSSPHNDPVDVIRHKLAYQRELFFVATLNGTVVGTIMGGYDGHRGWMYTLAVLPECQGRGIGTALILHTERELAARDCAKINLQVLATNADVVPMYEKLGYRVEERISMGKVLVAGAP
jgi:ribosomal protein S18 acetylase RimI-like enzyme